MRTRFQSSRAFSLVEIAIALGVVALCLVPILGLMATGSGVNRDSLQQTAAAALSREIYMDINFAASGAVTTGSSPRFGFIIPQPGSNQATWPNTLYFSDNDQSTQVGQSPATLPQGASPHYRASVRLLPPSDSTGTTMAWILITWPAMADAIPGTAPMNYSGSYEVFAAVGRN